jgi:hypothetical protein
VIVSPSLKHHAVNIFAFYQKKTRAQARVMVCQLDGFAIPGDVIAAW